MRFHIVSVGRNTGPFVEKHIASTLGQDFPDYAVTWVDDASDDLAAALWAQRVLEFRLDDFNILIRGRHHGGLKNTLDVVRAMDPEDVAVLVSADDALAHSNVLTRVKQEYDTGAMLTYGQWVTSDGQASYTRQYTREEFEDPYSAPFFATHLITFKAGLLQMIDDSCFRDEDGGYYQMTGDQSFMLPMLNLVSYEQARFIPEVLYIWNQHAGNDHVVGKANQERIERRIRGQG